MNLYGQDDINPFEISMLVYEHTREIEKEVEQEFISMLKNNVINPYEKSTMFLGKRFVFIYEGATRYKHLVRFKFLVLNKNYRRYIGRIYVDARV